MLRSSFLVYGELSYLFFDFRRNSSTKMVNNSQMWMVILIAFLLLFCLDVKVSQMEKRNAQLNTQCDISVRKCPIKNKIQALKLNLFGFLAASEVAIFWKIFILSFSKKALQAFNYFLSLFSTAWQWWTGPNFIRRYLNQKSHASQCIHQFCPCW